MTTELVVPFQFGPDGSVATTTDPVQQARQHLISVVLTGFSERVLRPSYGTPIHGAAFEPDDPIYQTTLTTYLRDAVSQWEPSVILHGVDTVSRDPNDGSVVIRMLYELAGTGQTQTAEIGTGGVVTERRA